MTIDKEKLKALAERAVAGNPPGGDGNPFPALAVRAVDVLALLAEIERLERRNSNQQESIRQYQDHMEGGESILSLANERDRLKAENEALRKDAERYRFVRKTWCPDWPSEKADAQIDAAMAKEASHGK